MRSRPAMLLLTLALLLVPLPARATVVYEFHGTTAALEPDPFHAAGVPSHAEAFTLTAPTFLPVPVNAPFDLRAKFLHIPWPDACPACLPGAGIFLSEQTFGFFAAPISAAIVDFDDIVNVGYSYLFLPGAFTTLGWHSTAEFSAPYGGLGPFENRGTLFVSQVPVPATLLLLVSGFAVAVGLAASLRPARGARGGPRSVR